MTAKDQQANKEAGHTANAPLTNAELAAVRQSVKRRSPLGGAAWTRRTARRLRLNALLNPSGRPLTRQTEQTQ